MHKRGVFLPGPFILPDRQNISAAPEAATVELQVERRNLVLQLSCAASLNKCCFSAPESNPVFPRLLTDGETNRQIETSALELYWLLVGLLFSAAWPHPMTEVDR